MPDVTSEKIVVHCESCAASFRVPASAAGRKGKCPKCGATFRVPVAEEELPAAVGAADDLLSGLAGGTALEVAPRPTGGGGGAGGGIRPCPSCGAAMGGGAVVCTGCGYNTQTGRKGRDQGAATAGGGVAAAIGGVASNPLLRGVAFGVGAALVCTGVWFGVAKATHREIGLIAWAIGGIVGFAVYSGIGSNSVTGGLLAAGLSIGSILLAKFLIIFFILAPLIEPQMREQFEDQELLALMLVHESMPPEEFDRLSEGEQMMKVGEAMGQVFIMEEDEQQRRLAQVPQFVESMVRANSGKLFRISLFDWKNLIPFLLAILTAAKLGSSGTYSGT